MELRIPAVTVNQISNCMQRVNRAMQVINYLQDQYQLGFLYELDATYITGREYASVDGSNNRRVGKNHIQHCENRTVDEQSSRRIL